MPNQLQVGNAEFWFAVIDNGRIGTPERWNGLLSTETESESESEAIYRDNIVYDTLEGVSNFKVTATLSHIPENFAINCLGWEKDAKGAWSVGTGARKDCAIMIKKTLMDGTTGAKVPVLDIFYQVSVAEPKIESETDEDKPSVEEIEIEFTAKPSTIVVDDVNKNITHGHITRTASNATFFDSYSTAVLVPSFNASSTMTMAESEEVDNG